VKAPLGIIAKKAQQNNRKIDKFLSHRYGDALVLNPGCICASVLSSFLIYSQASVITEPNGENVLVVSVSLWHSEGSRLTMCS